MRLLSFEDRASWGILCRALSMDGLYENLPSKLDRVARARLVAKLTARARLKSFKLTHYRGFQRPHRKLGRL